MNWEKIFLCSTVALMLLLWPACFSSMRGVLQTTFDRIVLFLFVAAFVVFMTSIFALTTWR